MTYSSNKSEVINVLIVDDEKNACINLGNLIAKFVTKNIRVAGIATSTAEALFMIDTLQPDAIFLDIDMPEENAFQFLQRIPPYSFDIVFVTAYDQYAVKAFRLNAVDYILKPIDIDELVNAVDRLYERRKSKNAMYVDKEEYSEVLVQLTNRSPVRKIKLKSVNGIELVSFEHIYFIEGEGAYSRVFFHKGDGVCEMLLSNSLSEYEELLPSDMFYRVHKSYLVNCTHINKFVSNESIHIVLKHNFSIPVSRRRVITLKKFLKSHGYLL